ncbi:UNKNOWN [Stylonychia lemnae]|uniref:LITAF domain-containing protein n=1 Tax=Stylonychia lemnae TaxID=5949 RepID=A0A077ZT36_STYLE|nr:UNKNOWN [Stylonychia lemnae]|eukprot:CDW72475.1 UNKNOWN [Stylonychia lemnae]
MYNQTQNQLDTSTDSFIETQNHNQHFPYQDYENKKVVEQRIIQPQAFGNPPMLNQPMYAQQAPYPGQQNVLPGQQQQFMNGPPHLYGQMNQPVIIVQQQPSYIQHEPIRYVLFGRRIYRAHNISVTQSKYGLYPTTIECPLCKQTMTTTIKKETTSSQCIFCIILACFVPPYCCIPYCIRSCYQHRHFCSSCKKCVD